MSIVDENFRGLQSYNHAMIDKPHRKGRSRSFAALAMIGMLTAGIVESADPLPKGTRVLAVKANIGQNNNFDDVFNESVEAGSETQVVPLDWRDLEISPATYEPDTNFLAIANYYYSARNVPIHLAIRPIHTNQKVVPSDLLNTPLDNPETIRRFKRLLDWIATQTPDVAIASLVIGSEIDIYMWGNADRWNEWIAFYAAVAPYARKTFPGTLISSETTYAAFAKPNLVYLRQMHENSDAIGVSYYPMQDGLSTVRAPESVIDTFATVARAIPDKPVMYYQIGYPSSTALGSSPVQQAQFISQAFRAWDRHSERIRMLNFQWMHEAPEFGIDQYVDYYQNDTPQFRAFLGSLGLKSFGGEAKPAWTRLIDEARVRGFGQVRQE